MNRKRGIAVLFTFCILLSGVAIATVPGNASASNVGLQQASEPSERPSDLRGPSETYGPGDEGTIDVSDRDWIYVELYGAQGGNGVDGGTTDGGSGGHGGLSAGWLNVSDVNTLDTAIPSQGEVDGYHNGESGEDLSSARSDPGGNGAGSTALTNNGNVLFESGGGGGGGGGHSTNDGEGSRGGNGGSGGEIGVTGGEGGEGSAEDSTFDDGDNGGPGEGYIDQSVVYGLTNEGSNAGDAYIEIYDPWIDSPNIQNFEYSDSDGFTANISDNDLEYPWGDRLNVTLLRNGTDSVATSQITESGNITIDHTVSGSDIYSLEVTDSYGDTTESDNLTVYGEGTADIRDEQTGDLLSNTNATLTAFGGDGNIYTIESNGNRFDISALPEQSYTLQIESDGYYTRTRTVDSPSEFQDVYLLDETTETTTGRFVLEDTTNTYSSSSILTIDRPIDTGDGRQYQPIVSDSFGTEGLSVQLEQGVRYRISVENEGGIMQVLGPYRGQLDETITVSPESGTIQTEDHGSWYTGARLSGSNIDAIFTDPTMETDSVSIRIVERNNESNVLVSGDEFTNPSNLTASYSIPEEYNGSNWIVYFDVDRNGEITTVSMQVGPTLDSVPANLGPMWQNVISVIIILTFGLTFSVLNRGVGAIVLALVGGALWWIGWLAGATAGVLITAYLFIAIGYAIYTKT